MTNPVTFFSRCKPQDVDAIEIVLAEKRIFIGYPMQREGAPYDPRKLRSCVVDLNCDDDEWDDGRSKSDGRRQYAQNRNLVPQITIGSIAMVPRPSHGVVYCGRIVSKFELEDAPAWYDRYMVIRGDQDGEDTWHGADIAQGWRVDDFKAIPVPRIPAWIRRSLFGRSTYGIVHPDPISGDPTDVMEKLLVNDRFEARDWTIDVDLIKKRLLEDFTPAAFEHLSVSLLQLEHPEEMWLQVGGSGDGGIDGIGADQQGQVSSLLQCKWQYWGGETFPTTLVWDRPERPLRKYLAVLRYPGGTPPSDCTFMDIDEIATLVAKHHLRLPQAVSMRVGANV